MKNSEVRKAKFGGLLSFPVISSIALLVAAIFVIRWIVETQRAPGSMTITEAQGMDMTSSKPPTGVQPVVVATVQKRDVAATAWYPATVFAFTDEEVVARLPGRLLQLNVYAGDSVVASQLLGKLDAPEYVAQASEASLMAQSKLSMATAALREQQAARAMFRKATAEKAAAESAIAGAQAESAAMTSERDQMLSEAKMAESELDENAAAAKYAEASLIRQQQLHRSGAISLDELQMAQRERDMAVARFRTATARVQSARQKAAVAEKKRVASESEVKAAKAMLSAANEDALAAKAMDAKAGAEAEARNKESRAVKSSASGFSAIADYRNLRALSSGIVSERLVSPGTSVMPGQAILRIKVINKVRVQAEVPQAHSDDAMVGGSAKVEVNGKVSTATISAVFPSVNETTRTFKVEVLLNNPEGKIRPGSFARIALVGPQFEEKSAVPSSAIQDDLEGGHYVWVVSEKAGDGTPQDWTCTMHPEVSRPGPGICPICKMDLVPRSRSGKYVVTKKTVVIGKSDGKYTQILSGVTDGDEVVIEGFASLQPGTPIEPTQQDRAMDETPESDSKGSMNRHTVPPATNTERESKKPDLSSGERPSTSKGPSEQAKKPTPSKKKWTCPMDPQIVRDSPGTCPICKMDLVPMEPPK